MTQRPCVGRRRRAVDRSRRLNRPNAAARAARSAHNARTSPAAEKAGDGAGSCGQSACTRLDACRLHVNTGSAADPLWPNRSPPRSLAQPDPVEQKRTSPGTRLARREAQSGGRWRASTRLCGLRFGWPRVREVVELALQPAHLFALGDEVSGAIHLPAAQIVERSRSQASSSIRNRLPRRGQ